MNGIEVCQEENVTGGGGGGGGGHIAHTQSC